VSGNRLRVKNVEKKRGREERAVLGRELDQACAVGGRRVESNQWLMALRFLVVANVPISRMSTVDEGKLLARSIAPRSPCQVTRLYHGMCSSDVDRQNPKLPTSGSRSFLSDLEGIHCSEEQGLTHTTIRRPHQQRHSIYCTVKLLRNLFQPTVSST